MFIRGLDIALHKVLVKFEVKAKKWYDEVVYIFLINFKSILKMYLERISFLTSRYDYYNVVDESKGPYSKFKLKSVSVLSFSLLKQKLDLRLTLNLHK